MTRKHWIVWLLVSYRDIYYRWLPRPFRRPVSFLLLGDLVMDIACYLDPDDRIYNYAYAQRVAD